MFGTNNGHRGSVPFVNHPNIRHKEFLSRTHQKTTTKLPTTADSLIGTGGLRTKPTSIYPTGRFGRSFHNSVGQVKQSDKLKIAEQRQWLNNGNVKKSDEEKVIDLSKTDNSPDTASMRKKSSDLFSVLESAYDTSDIENFEDKNDQESPTISPALQPQTGPLDLTTLIRPQKVSSQDQRPNYNSWNTYNPGQFKENSPEWQMAMLQYLIDMKMNGHKIQEVSFDEVRYNA